MELKIEIDGKIMEAAIKVVDGVMVVSPKEVKFEPKDGDVVFSGCSLISIFKKMSSATSFASYAALSNGEFKKEFDFWSASNIRPATEKEKQKLFDKLAEEGYEWKAETKELVKLKWKPSMYDPYYIPFYETCEFIPMGTNWNGRNKDNIRYNKGLCFKTEEECQEFCNRLNQAIEGVRP